MDFDIIFTRAFTLFLTLDAFANAVMAAGIVKPYSATRQRQILVREVLFALLLLITFYFFGGFLLDLLSISQSAIKITGGIVFFFFALYLLFPGQSGIQVLEPGQDPFIVPIAIPLIAGPSSLAVVMLYSHDKALGMTGGLLAIFLGWFATAIVIVASTHIVKLIGPIGARITERIMGLICALVGVKMILAGILLFLNSN